MSIEKSVEFLGKKCIIEGKQIGERERCVWAAWRRAGRGYPMSENFLHDLNNFFSKKYSNFDMISALPSYESVTISMVLKNTNRIEQGEVATNEVRKIFYQPQAEKVLQEFKERYVDNNFTFSIRVAPFRVRVKAFLRGDVPGKALVQVIRKYGEEPQALAGRLGIEENAWKNVLRGYYIPEKVLLFKLGLLLAMRQEDFSALMEACGAYYDFADARDVVVKYLMDYRVFNPDMIGAAFDEFHIRRIL